MTNYEFPKVPEIEEAYRTAYRALKGIVEPDGGEEHYERWPSGHFDTEVFPLFSSLVREAEMLAVANVGSLVGWKAGNRDGDWSLLQTCVDFDGGDDPDDGIQVDCDYDDYMESGFGQAARAYKREAGWDFTPGDRGIWLMCLAPISGCGGGDDLYWQGYLVGFVILYDRDGDGVYESMGHMWTAKAWRRQGIACKLLMLAKSRYGFKHIEGPVTDLGVSAIKAWEQETAEVGAGQ